MAIKRSNDVGAQAPSSWPSILGGLLGGTAGVVGGNAAGGALGVRAAEKQHAPIENKLNKQTLALQKRVPSAAHRSSRLLDRWQQQEDFIKRLAERGIAVPADLQQRHQRLDAAGDHARALEAKLYRRLREIESAGWRAKHKLEFNRGALARVGKSIGSPIGGILGTIGGALLPAALSATRKEASMNKTAAAVDQIFGKAASVAPDPLAARLRLAQALLLQGATPKQAFVAVFNDVSPADRTKIAKWVVKTAAKANIPGLSSLAQKFRTALSGEAVPVRQLTRAGTPKPKPTPTQQTRLSARDTEEAAAQAAGRSMEGHFGSLSGRMPTGKPTPATASQQPRNAPPPNWAPHEQQVAAAPEVSAAPFPLHPDTVAAGIKPRATRGQMTRDKIHRLRAKQMQGLNKALMSTGLAAGGGGALGGFGLSSLFGPDTGALADQQAQQAAILQYLVEQQNKPKGWFG